MTLDGDGNLDIAGDLTVTGQNIKSPADLPLFFNTDKSMYFDIDEDNDETDQIFRWRAYNTTLMTLTEAADLTLAGDLTVDGGDIVTTDATGGDLFLRRNDSSIVADEVLGNIFFQATEDGSNVSFGAAIRGVATETFVFPSDEGTKLEFMTTANGSGLYGVKMTLDGDGNLGIGTTDPQANLHISETGAPSIRLSDTDADTDAEVAAFTTYYRGEDTARIGWVGYGSTGNEHFTIQNETSAGSVTIGTNATTALTIDSSQNTTIAGDLTVTGNDIKGSGGTAITMDGSNNVTIAGDLYMGTGGSPATTNIKDSGGDSRISITNAGGVILRDLSGGAEFSVNNGFAYVYGDLQVVGNLELRYQPAVCAVLTSNQAIGSSLTKIIFNDDSQAAPADSLFDVGGDYNTSNGIFTAPEDGKYLISAASLIQGAVVSNVTYISCVTTKSTAGTDYFQANYYGANVLDTDGYVPLQGTWLVNMDQNDQAYINVECTAGTGATYAFGHVNYWHTRLNIIKVA
jgi:hypothetical protein